MRYGVSFMSAIRPLAYAISAPALVLAQHVVVILAFRFAGYDLIYDAEFWFLPLRRFASMPGLPAWAAALGFVLSLIITGAIAMLSFRRARWSRALYFLAPVTIVPGAQFVAIAILAVMPRMDQDETRDPVEGIEFAHVIQGVLAGIGIIVLAVLISAVTLGVYGWGLFVMTPFLVGSTTGYLANRSRLLGRGQTAKVVLSAAALGTVALIMFALEGLICIVLAAPLGAAVALLGGSIGRWLAQLGHTRGHPLMSIALLPALFMLEAAMPPALPIDSQASIDIAARPAIVWQALIGNAPISSGPGLLGVAGLAYPISGQLLGTGVGAIRLGHFSTGIAQERVTEWSDRRRLAFVVVDQPPAMAEMSPYRHVHAPHIKGYFDTGVTRFVLEPLPGGRTRLTVTTTHVLRIDPVLYWEPIARLAIGMNVDRVLQDIRSKAERVSGAPIGQARHRVASSFATAA